MGIFTRVLDIAGSNINAMIDNAEDPEKMIKLMIREMEDTLVDVKRSCAGVMANSITVERQLAGAQTHERSWEKKAQHAVEKNREAGLCYVLHFGVCDGLNKTTSHDVRVFEKLLRSVHRQAGDAVGL